MRIITLTTKMKSIQQMSLVHWGNSFTSEKESWLSNRTQTATYVRYAASPTHPWLFTYVTLKQYTFQGQNPRPPILYRNGEKQAKYMFIKKNASHLAMYYIYLTVTRNRAICFFTSHSCRRTWRAVCTSCARPTSPFAFAIILKFFFFEDSRGGMPFQQYTI